MHENEVPEEIIQAAEHAADAVRSSLPVVQAAGYAGGALQSLVAGLQAQLTEPLRALAAFQAAQIEGSLRSLAAFQAAQIGLALRSALPIIMASQQLAELDRNVKAMAGGRLLSYADQIALARGVGLAQLAELAVRPAEPRTVTAGAHLTVTPTFTAVAKVSKAAEREPVSVQQEVHAEAGRSIDAVAFAVVLVWLWALTMPAAQVHLPPEAQEILNGLYATVGLALIVTSRMRDNHKR